MENHETCSWLQQMNPQSSNAKLNSTIQTENKMLNKDGQMTQYYDV